MTPRHTNENSVRSLLGGARERIEAASARMAPGSCETPYLDALVLLGESMGLPKERLLADMDAVPDPDQRDRFASLVERRCLGVPVSYLLGRKEFFGRTFAVSSATLVPRPETELLVEVALSLVDTLDGPIHLHDCCTGSGCVAITIAAERPGLTVTASDVSRDAVAVAVENADRILGCAAGAHAGPADAGRCATDAGPPPTGARDLPPAPRRGTAIEFWVGDRLTPLRDAADRVDPPRIITANPPYLSDNEYAAMARRGWPEPELALRGGPDGLDIIRALAADARRVLARDGRFACEIGSSQADAVRAIFSTEGFVDVVIHNDLAGHARVCVGRMPDDAT
jgi:release factor glutamine methyltransferase